jgi:hypothetical protein
MNELEGINHRVVDLNRVAIALDPKLFGQRPVELAGAIAKQRGERGGDVTFRKEVQRRQRVNLVVVGFDGSVIGLQAQRQHGNRF